MHIKNAKREEKDMPASKNQGTVLFPVKKLMSFPSSKRNVLKGGDKQEACATDGTDFFSTKNRRCLLIRVKECKNI